MAIYENQPKNVSSEYYNLSGENPVKEPQDSSTQKKLTRKIAIFTVAFILIAVWFWWNFVQIDTASK